MRTAIMRIVYLSSEYPAISHTFIYREIQALRDQGAEVCTASIRRPDHLQSMTAGEQSEAAKTFYIKDSSLIRLGRAHVRLVAQGPKAYWRMLRRAVRLSRQYTRNLFKALAYCAEAGLLLEWMQAKRVDHLHVHFANPAATVALIAQAYGSIEYSLSVHGPDIFANVHLSALPAKFEQASSIRCISHYCRSQVCSLIPAGHWDKTRIVRCGVDLDMFAPRPDPGNAVPEILCVGRLVPVKGQQVLIQACAQLVQEGYALHLTLIGDGPDRQSLEQAVADLNLQDQVTLTGAVGQDQVHGYLDQADLFVLPSFAEGVPVVLMEAMAKTVACVSTRITGIPELIEHGHDGLLCFPSDVEGLARCMRKLLDSPDHRRKLGMQGRSKVAGYYSLPGNCRAMADFFRQRMSAL